MVVGQMKINECIQIKFKKELIAVAIVNRSQVNRSN